MRRIELVLIFMFLTVATFNASVFAGDQIKPQTFQKFTKVAGFEKQYNQMISIFVSSFQQGMIAGFQDNMSKRDISAEAKEKLNPIINEAALDLELNLENVIKNEIRFNDLVEKVYLPVYRKYFSESEINELIKFYNSQIGKKVSMLTPSIMKESSDTFNQMYGQKVQALGGELIYNEINKLIIKAEEVMGKI